MSQVSPFVRITKKLDSKLKIHEILVIYLSLEYNLTTHNAPFIYGNLSNKLADWMSYKQIKITLLQEVWSLVKTKHDTKSQQPLYRKLQ